MFVIATDSPSNGLSNIYHSHFMKCYQQYFRMFEKFLLTYGLIEIININDILHMKFHFSNDHIINNIVNDCLPNGLSKAYHSYFMKFYQ